MSTYEVLLRCVLVLFVFAIVLCAYGIWETARNEAADARARARRNADAP